MYDIRKNIINSLAVLGLSRFQFCKKFGFDLPNFSCFLNGEPTLGMDRVQTVLNILAAELAKLKRYEITFLLGNGDRIKCRVDAPNGDTAIERIMKQPEFIQGLGNAEILQTTLKEIEPLKLDKDNYVLQPSKDAGWWVLTDKAHKIVCKFHEGQFNQSQTFTRLFDSNDLDELEYATVMRQFGDYLQTFHKDLL